MFIKKESNIFVRVYVWTYVRMGSYLHLYGFARTTTTTTMTMAKAVMTISVKRLACKRTYVFLHNVVYIYIFTMVGARLPSQLFVDLKIKSWLWPKF